MARIHKTSYKMYFAWNYLNEIDDLNKASENGWQLIRGGCFSSKFIKNPGLQYRYQIDFGKITDMPRYIETYREQGWEYINSTFNNFHYFRKLYDPSLPEEEYEIYTDKESLDKMKKRWSNMAVIFSVLLILFVATEAVFLIITPRLPTLILFLTMLFEGCILLIGTYVMRHSAKAKSRKLVNILPALFVLVIVLGLTGSILFSVKRSYFSWGQNGEEFNNLNSQSGDIGISYTDNYALDLDIESPVPITVSILNSDGDAVYSQTAEQHHEQNTRLKLRKGIYNISVCAETSADSDWKMYISID